MDRYNVIPWELNPSVFSRAFEARALYTGSTFSSSSLSSIPTDLASISSSSSTSASLASSHKRSRPTNNRLISKKTRISDLLDLLDIETMEIEESAKSGDANKCREAIDYYRYCNRPAQVNDYEKILADMGYIAEQISVSDYYYKNGSLMEAITYCKMASSDDRPDLLKKLGVLYYEAKNYKGTLDLLEPFAIRGCPASASIVSIIYNQYYNSRTNIPANGEYMGKILLYSRIAGLPKHYVRTVAVEYIGKSNAKKITIVEILRILDSLLIKPLTEIVLEYAFLPEHDWMIKNSIKYVGQAQVPLPIVDVTDNFTMTFRGV